MDCPHCRHDMRGHHTDDTGRYQCYHRMSRDNNDFCGCTHNMPDERRLVLLERELDEVKTKIRILKRKMKKDAGKVEKN